MHFPLFILPFDHRNGLSKIIGKTYPFSHEDLAQVADLKHLVFEAIVKVRDDYKGTGSLGCLFDEETAQPIITEAQSMGLPVAVSLEKSGTKTFELILGDAFAQHFQELRPTYAKALIHYQAGNPESQTQRELLKKISNDCATIGVPLMLEILLDKPEGPAPADFLGVFKELHEAGVKVGMWKIEGFNSSDEWKQIATAAQAPMIILGRGQDQAAVETWVRAAAESGVVDGFAIGRTIFQTALENYVQNKISRAEAVMQVANNYQHFIQLWEEYA